VWAVAGALADPGLVVLQQLRGHVEADGAEPFEPVPAPSLLEVVVKPCARCVWPYPCDPEGDLLVEGQRRQHATARPARRRAHATRLRHGRRSVGDQAGKALEAERAEVAGTVERVRAGLHQSGGVAEVVQVGGGTDP